MLTAKQAKVASELYYRDKYNKNINTLLKKGEEQVELSIKQGLTNCEVDTKYYDNNVKIMVADEFRCLGYSVTFYFHKMFISWGQ